MSLDPLTTLSVNESNDEFGNYSVVMDSEGLETGGGDNPWLDTSCYDMVLAGKYRFLNFYTLSPEMLLKFLYKRHNYILKFYVSPLIALFGILFNVVFLGVLARVREMKTVTNVYLGNLAVADTVFLIASTVDILLTLKTNPGFLLHNPYHTTTQCVSHSLLTKVSFYGSICMVTLVTFERYMAICHPIKHRLIGGKKYTLKVTLISWLAALTMGTLSSMTYVKSRSICILWPPGMKDFVSYPIGDVQTVCLPINNGSHDSFNWFTVTYGIQTSFFILNLGLNIILYILIICRLGKRNVASERNGRSNVYRVRNQVAKMLIINGTIFFMLTLPYEVGTFAEFVEDASKGNIVPLDSNQTLNFEFYGTCLRLVNSSLNPLIYGLSNPRYRQAYRKAFGCGLKDDGRDEKKLTMVSAISTTEMSIFK